jgi:predicted ATPase
MDTERKQTYDEAVKTYDLMIEAYEDCGDEVVKIPRASSRPAGGVYFE